MASGLGYPVRSDRSSRSVAALRTVHQRSRPRLRAGRLFHELRVSNFSSKLQNAVALTVHSGWLVFPALAWLAFRRASVDLGCRLRSRICRRAFLLDPNPLFWVSLGTGVLVLLCCVAQMVKKEDRDTVFLCAWVTIFFAAALVLFFAGSARYLSACRAHGFAGERRLAGRNGCWLPDLRCRPARTLAERDELPALGCLSELCGGAAFQFQHRRVWINSEWALRYYAEAEGGLPLWKANRCGLAK